MLTTILLILSMVFQNPYIVQAAFGNTYYVAVNGNDQNNGSIVAPWRTIQKAVDNLAPGDTLLVRGGVYNEFVTLRNSGTESGGYITIQNYPNEYPIIDGANLAMSSNNQALIYLSNSNYLKITGFELRNLTTGSSSYDPAGIRLKNGGSHIELRNNNIHHIQNTSNSGNAHGIHVLGNSSTPITNLTISGNEVHHLDTGKSESLTLSGNIDGFSITNNKVYENNNIGIELAGFYGACSGSCTDQTRNGLVAGNTVYHIDSSHNAAYGTGVHAAGGIYADGAANIIIEQNHVYANDFGIELASETKGRSTSNITVRNNFIHHNYGAGLIMGGASSSNGGAESNQVVNNTFLENDTLKQGYGEITMQWYNVNNLIANNILYSNAQKISVNKVNSSGSGNKLNYNLLYNASGVNSTSWRWQGTTYNSWNAFKAATAQDLNSLFGNPMFVDKVNNNVRLTSSSAAVNKGSNLYVGNGSVDYAGGTRIREAIVDIGALEYVAGQDPVTHTQPVSKYLIDGDAADWSSVTALSTGTSNAAALKAVYDQSNLLLLVQGTNLSKKSQFFFNTDNNVNTGYTVSGWTSSGAEYLLENGVLYHYSGKGGSDWSWKLEQTYKGTSNFANTDKVLEVSIPLFQLGSTTSSILKIGFVYNDSKTVKLPVSGAMATVPNAGDLLQKTKK